MPPGDSVHSAEDGQSLRKEKYPRLKFLFKPLDDCLDFKKRFIVTYYPALAFLSILIWTLEFLLIYLGYTKNNSLSQLFFDSGGYFFLPILFFVMYLDFKKKVVKRDK